MPGISKKLFLELCALCNPRCTRDLPISVVENKDNTVKRLLSGHRIKRTPCIKRTVAEVPKFISLIYLK